MKWVFAAVVLAFTVAAVVRGIQGVVALSRQELHDALFRKWQKGDGR